MLIVVLSEEQIHFRIAEKKVYVVRKNAKMRDMTNNLENILENREIEAKFPISSADEWIARLESLNLVCDQSNCHEINYRFDTAERKLSAAHQVLRLRTENGSVTLTYKCAEKSQGGIAFREEIETHVSDEKQMQLILERLSFEVYFMYEKYRSVFQFGGVLLMVDHTPIGDFLEIEGPDEKMICDHAERLGLDWKTSTAKSYQSLFKEWAESVHFSGRDMLFNEIVTVGSYEK